MKRNLCDFEIQRSLVFFCLIRYLFYFKYITDIEVNSSLEVGLNAPLYNELLYQGRRYDTESNLYYYRARYYDPILGRFLSTDPMGYKDSMNLYQAFNMNGYNFVDPFGEAIALNTNLITTQKQIILNNLAKLTDDPLFINKNNEIRIRKLQGGTKPEGTKLIRRLIRSQRKVEITIAFPGDGNSENPLNWTDAENNIGSDTVVELGPTKANLQIETLNPRTGRVAPASRPLYIGFGHELIHADHSTRGVATDWDLWGVAQYNDVAGRLQSYRARIEELETVGITNWTMLPSSRRRLTNSQYNAFMNRLHTRRNSYITENDLRNEVIITLPSGQKIKLNPRGKY